jgi:RNA polymerase sigma-70 factor (ECF subfamily)
VRNARVTRARLTRPFSARGNGSLAELDEAQLIARLRARDIDALGELYRQFGGAMLGLARSMLRNREEADDVVEDALLKIHSAAPGFRGTRGLRTWTLRIVANRCRDALRRRKFAGPPPDEMDPLASAGLSVDPIREWEEGEDRNRALIALERALAGLPREQREAVILVNRLGLPLAEAGEVLGASEGAMKSRLFRARETLRVKLREALGE